MTSFEIRRFDFTDAAQKVAASDETLRNWPVVYVLDQPGRRGVGRIYFGESLNFASRMHSHLQSDEKASLTTVRVVVDETFNKSACLDLESILIRYAAGDGSRLVINRNDGVVDANYFDRSRYRRVFDDVFEELRQQGLFQRTIPEIVNSELFKLSPFKALNTDQAAAVEEIMEALVEDLGDDSERTSEAFVRGAPGTGKTVIAIYLMKLIADIGQERDEEVPDPDTMFSDYFLPGYREQFRNKKIGLVVPQQALRKSIQRVFARTPGLERSMVVSAFDVGKSSEQYDILIIDEAHRLNQYAAQAIGQLTKDFKEINERLFHGERPQASQLDWLRAKARHLILMLDTDQSVRPADLPREEVEAAVRASTRQVLTLNTQMRTEAGETYVDYVKDVLSHRPPTTRLDFGPYELGIFDNAADLVAEIKRKDAEHGLSRGWSLATRGSGSARRTRLPTTSFSATPSCAGTPRTSTG